MFKFDETEKLVTHIWVFINNSILILSVTLIAVNINFKWELGNKAIFYSKVHSVFRVVHGLWKERQFWIILSPYICEKAGRVTTSQYLFLKCITGAKYVFWVTLRIRWVKIGITVLYMEYLHFMPSVNPSPNVEKLGVWNFERQ